MKTALIIIAVISVGALVIGSIAHRYWTPEKKAEKVVHVITKKLDLNEIQKAKLNNIREQLLAARQEMRKNREAGFKDLQSLLSHSKLDQDRANSLISGHIGEFSSRSPKLVSAVGDFWDSLDVDQQAKVKTKLEKLHSCRNRWGFGRHT